MNTIYIIQDNGNYNFSSLLTITNNILVVCSREDRPSADPGRRST